MKRLSILVLSALLATSCQVAPALSPSAPAAQTASTATAVTTPAYKSPVLPKVEVRPEAKVQIRGTQVKLEVQLPALSALRPADFKTQLLDLATAAKITAQIRDSYGKVYTPVGADGNGQVAYPANGQLNLSFSAVVPDQLLFVEMQVSDGTNDIPQADLAVVIKHTGIGDVTANMGFQSTPTAKAMKELLSVDAPRARAINLTDLNSLMTSITGVTGTDPVFSYVCHPTLVDTAALAIALRTQDPGALTHTAYRRVGATVGLTVTGLVGGDTLEVQATDAASARKLAVATGSSSLTGVTPGTGIHLKVGATASNSTQYTFVVTPNTNLTLTNGMTTNVTIVATPAAVTLTSLAPTAGAINSDVILTGTGFSTTPANNLVKFGNTTATVSAVNPAGTELTVKVPAGVSGTQAVTVQVGSQTSSATNFSVTPTLASLDVSSGIVGSTLTINGTGFSPTAASNTINFGATTVTAATANAAGTQLTVTVPAGISGTRAVSVQVGTQTSNSSNFAVTPVLSSLSVSSGIVGSLLTLNGSGFSSVINGNTVSFGGTNVSATANAAGTFLTVNVPDGFGSRNVSVSIGSQTSASLPHVVIPNINFLSAGTGSQGDTLDLNISGYDPTLTNNILKLGNTILTPSSPSAGVLRVTVPNDPAGPANATLQTGAQTSSAYNFTLKPMLVSLSTAAGAISGKAALIRGQVLTINGSNFSLTPGSNNVSFTMGANTFSALATSATASQLTVVIPGTVDIVGDVSIAVTTNTQTSNALTGIVPTVNVTINGSGFN